TFPGTSHTGSCHFPFLVAHQLPDPVPHLLTAGAIVHVPIGKSDDLSIGAKLKAVEHLTGGFGHCSPHRSHRRADVVRRGANEESIVHWGADLNPALDSEAGSDAHHFRAVSLHGVVRNRAWIGLTDDARSPAKHRARLVAEHRRIDVVLVPAPELVERPAMGCQQVAGNRLPRLAWSWPGNA